MEMFLIAKKKAKKSFDSAKNIKAATFPNYHTILNIEFIIERLKLRFWDF